MLKQAVKETKKKLESFHSKFDSYVSKKQKFLESQIQLHISERENTHNTVYLNAQRDLLTQMKEDLKL